VRVSPSQTFFVLGKDQTDPPIIDVGLLLGLIGISPFASILDIRLIADDPALDGRDRILPAFEELTRTLITAHTAGG
jgi:hypothetical protein